MRRQEVLADRRPDDGMTLIELTVVLMVMAIVMSIAGSILFSLSKTASRNDAVVTDEQEASTVLAQVSRDIRSAHQVTFAAFASAAPTQEIELQMNQPSNTWVEWVYTPTAATVNGVSQPSHTLARYTSSSATGTFKESAPSVSTPVNVANGSTALFRYFTGSGSELVAQPGNTAGLQTCTTRVMVTLLVATEKNLTAVPTFQLTDDVAITDQEAQWSTLPCS
jgi:prepilin-type N-terminal cleavage/methylation domain-containing protein